MTELEKQLLSALERLQQ
ncbi:MbeD/MobD family mobilization/exclusion protein, partial [Klebsiella pneumoniae]